ncbi:putative MCE family protein [Mycolicibacterium insubricum]|uniref:Mammalian cell entry protein n=1 Tax=Mycolicibacterium insubricum TaxID=444597 RepID=A0A1X0D377_9MYCO|nr:MCE family protein [Mycolicibacterium insubricum]MCB9439267.1 MCE family protein [Mycolicibacterium sp.]MCV7080419.1 MCE family protein [Mycolicibacterium insubricum]ORA66864.1 mammalian cell entry protein [Mycolicibacterium insubricum]BBZ64977.1 putative MCE family protein [Mycolicibacterium insubricum]
MSSARKRLLVIAGIIVVAALVIGGFIFSEVRSHLTTKHYTAQFESAAGIFEDNLITVLGMPVGRVSKVTPKQGYVEVEFTVDGEVKVPKKVEAVALQTAILTDRQIELTPVFKDGDEELPSGTTIGRDQTRVPVEFDEVLGTLDKLATALSGNKDGTGPVADVVANSAAVVDGNGEKIKSALSELSDAFRLSVNRGDTTKEQMTTIVQNVNSLFGAAADNDATLRQFGTTVNALTQVLADENLGTGTTGRKINDVLKQAGDILAANRGHIKTIVSNTNTVLTTTVDKKRDLAEFLDVTPLVLENVYNAVDRENGSLRIRLMTDRVLFETQTSKEMCNILRLRQLGCSTGTIQDFGPDFGLTYMLDGLAAMGQK